jgi:hypothetical protein
MFTLEGLNIPGLDLAAGTFTLPVWAAATAAGLLLIFLLLALFRASFSELMGTVVRLGIAAIAIGFAWTFVEHASERDRDEARRALDARTVALTGLATAPGSALACLDALASEGVDGSCEKVIFASPESVAAAASYVEARLSLLADAVDFAKRRDASYIPTLISLRQPLESDRFGLVAQVLATRDACTAEKCDALSLLRNPNRVRANLRERTFDGLVARYASAWPTRARSTATSTVGPQGQGSSAGTASPSSSTGLSFPSAASIPPISIMNNEPPAASQAPPAAAPSSQTTSPPAARRQTQARPARTQSTAPPPPTPIGPPPSTTQ